MFNEKIAFSWRNYLILAEKTYVWGKLSSETFQHFLQLHNLSVLISFDEVRGFASSNHKINRQLRFLVLVLKD